MPRLLTSAVVLSLALTAVAPLALAKGVDTDTDTKSKAALKKTCDFYKGLKGFSTNISDPLTSRKISLAVQRPNFITLTCKDNEMGTVISNGKTLYIYSPLCNLYQESKAPATLSELLKFDADSKFPSDFSAATSSLNLLPFALLGDNSYTDIVNGDSYFEYVGTEKVGKFDCHHLLKILKKPEQVVNLDSSRALEIKHEYLPKHIWIDTNESNPLVRKESQVIVMTQSIKGKLTSQRMEIIHQYDDLIANPVFNSNKFNYVLNKNATKVASLGKSPERLNAMMKRAQSTRDENKSRLK